MELTGLVLMVGIQKVCGLLALFVVLGFVVGIIAGLTALFFKE
jgi:hypothetical protein